MLAARTSLAEVDPMEAPLALPPNAEMCEQYGGCPYRDKCNLSPAQIVESIAARSEKVARAMLTEDSMANENGGPNATVNLLERMRARKAGIQATPIAPVVPIDGLTKAAAEDAPDWSKAVPINPPESALPPAPPVSASAETTEASSNVDATKRKPGRARGSKPADPPLLLATTPGPAAASREPAEPVVVVEPGNDPSEIVTVTWGEETFSPVQFQNFRVGPFSVSGRVHPDETRGAALRRLSVELHAFAVEERARKAESFKAALGK